MTRLIETASETPRAAAEVIGKLREEVSNNLERDNTLLEVSDALRQGSHQAPMVEAKEKEAYEIMEEHGLLEKKNTGKKEMKQAAGKRKSAVGGKGKPLEAAVATGKKKRNKSKN